MKSYDTEIPVETTVKLREFAFDFSESEVADILRDYALNTLLPEHFRAQRKALPAAYIASNVHSTVFNVPTIQDEYNEDGKFEVRIRF